MARRKGGRAPDSTSVTVPAPVGGLNDRDPILNMPATDAVILDNWWPEPGLISIRKGYIGHVKNLLGPVETLVSYYPPSGDLKIFAVANGAIFDATYSQLDDVSMFTKENEVANEMFAADNDSPIMFAAYDMAAVYSGLSNSRFQVAETTTAGGSFQLWLNGEDDALLYDGTDFTPINSSSTPAITGVSTSDLIDGVVFKNRLFLVEKNSMSLWYLPVTSISGAAASIPMGQIFRRGGYIVTVQPWTIDAGEGSDDLLAVLSSNGEVAVFAGTDPTEAALWKLIGVFYIGRPVGQRPCIKFGGDLLIICEDGVFPLSGALTSASVDGRVAITDKIQNSIRKSVNSTGREFGWQLCQSPINSALILNVPSFQGTNTQYMQNTLTGAWSRFTGIDALCWLDTPIGLLFGSKDGNVYKAWQTYQDDGKSITADACQAFSSYGAHSLEKYFNIIRPYLESSGSPSITYVLCGDFVISDPDSEMSYSSPEGMIWNHMVWGGMKWGGKINQIYDRRVVGLIAKTAAPRVAIQNNGANVTWSATDVMYSRGWHL